MLEQKIHQRWRIYAPFKQQSEDGILQGVFDGNLCLEDMLVIMKEIVSIGVEEFETIELSASEYLYTYEDGRVIECTEFTNTQQTIILDTVYLS